MIDLYYWTTPNGHKITIFLEEAAVAYQIVPVNISKGDQFKPEFLAISPNNRMPAIVDHHPKDGGKPISVFESGAILLYVSEKTGKYLGWAPRPGRGDGMAVLANGRSRPDGGSESSLLSICAEEDTLRRRTVRQGDEPSLWRAQQAAFGS